MQDQKDRIYSTVRSKSTSATVTNLKPSTAYVFQIRAFTEAGYGTYGPRLEITTKEEATGRMQIQAAGTRQNSHRCFSSASYDLCSRDVKQISVYYSGLSRYKQHLNVRSNISK